MDSFPKRKHPRLKQYNYSTGGAYFITICTQNHRCLLSQIIPGNDRDTPTKIRYLDYGKIAAEQLTLLEKRFLTVNIDRYVIMPNHIHMILLLKASESGEASPTIMDIVCAYKSLVTRECKKCRPIDKLFQTSFYEHVIRGQKDYLETVEYVENNPKQWEMDRLYSSE